MNTLPPYHWLIGSFCIWLLCAWSMQRPAESKTQSAIVQTDTTKKQVIRYDPKTGLALDKDLPIIVGNCTACHSGKIIMVSHFSREKWIERIRWMQKTQKLWDLGTSEPAILTYLTTYYGPIDTPFDGRRLPLPTPVWHTR